MKDLIFDPIIPIQAIWILGLLFGAGTIWVYLNTAAALGVIRRTLLLCFRLLGIGLVLALLLQPSRQERYFPPVVDRMTVFGLDTSLSMKQRDVNQGTRFDAARSLLLDAGVLGPGGEISNPLVGLYQFGEDATPVPGSLAGLFPNGKTTRFHRSVSTMLSSTGQAEPNALILLTDGHDFELVNPAKTGAAARARKIPIYAVALGKQGKVRDVSARITNFQPYCYVKQKARIAAALRVIGCEFEDLTVQLMRHGQVIDTKRINSEEAQELNLEFEVTEPETGQYEYEVRVQPVEKETETSNNSAITYLNVIDQQIRVLLLEGDPYWDTTFLQRSLMRNDKFNLDAMISYGPKKVRAIRKSDPSGPLGPFNSLESFAPYDVIILGRKVNLLLEPSQAAFLDGFARDLGGVVVLARGQPFDSETPFSDLEPILWGPESASAGRLDPTAEGRAASPFRSILSASGGMEELPEMVSARRPSETKPLTSTLALSGAQFGAPEPAIVHRRYGQGQVVSVGVEGLWRWGLNVKAEGPNTPFDRFWDQMMLWLLASRDFVPNRQFSFRPSSANVMLGEKVSFRLRMRQYDPRVKSVPVVVSYGNAEVARINMAVSINDPTRLVAEFLPDKTGRYQARADFPDGTSQESRFIVFNENQEETEVATDVLCLRRLCESSGGRVIEPGDLGRLFKELVGKKVEAAPEVQICPIWNQAWVFWTCGILFGIDWFLRRRWGLC